MGDNKESGDTAFDLLLEIEKEREENKKHPVILETSGDGEYWTIARKDGKDKYFDVLLTVPFGLTSLRRSGTHVVLMHPHGEAFLVYKDVAAAKKVIINLTLRKFGKEFVAALPMPSDVWLNYNNENAGTELIDNQTGQQSTNYSAKMCEKPLVGVIC